MTLCCHGSLISIRVDYGSVILLLIHIFFFFIMGANYFCWYSTYILFKRQISMHSSNFIVFFKTIRFEKKIRLCKKLKRLKKST
jgi:hypothetical protein